ncbi:very short patch repair endonuclease [Micromonospora sp. CPCC 206061]|uniref:very short patch repair endonuclease n=1 Tax=Micromonospora sp. CPCC 206061 TaxID=3122410 RepID=UPI002FF34714
MQPPVRRHPGRPASTTRTPKEDIKATSWASDPAVRARMQRQQTRDTGPELALRRLLHAAGLRYRVDVAPLGSLRRRADIVFGPARVAVFVDGCFWHGCSEHGSRQTKANTTYWSDKIARNRARDASTDDLLARAGWLVVRVWEHENALHAAQRIGMIVRERRR